MTSRTEARAEPLTDRGRRTRANLLEAGRAVFEQRGYAATRMADIALAAGVSHGTTYTWFADKESVLRALVDDIVTEVYAALAIGEDVPDPQQRMVEGNRRYLASYRRHGRMLEVVEEAAAADPARGRTPRSCSPRDTRYRTIAAHRGRCSRRRSGGRSRSAMRDGRGVRSALVRPRGARRLVARR